MAIAIEGFSVVGLKSRINEKYFGGMEALSKTVPNSTELADDELWRCSFMVVEDARKFLKQLHISGLESSRGPDSDFVLVCESDLSVTPYCEWLQVGRFKNGAIAWSAGTTPEQVVALQGWTPGKGSDLIFVPSEHDEHVEFLRLDGKISVYFDKRLGREVYITRLEPDPNEVFQIAFRVISDYCRDPAQPTPTGESEAKVREAVASLEQIAQQFPGAMEVQFWLGKGKFMLGDLDGAYEPLRIASALAQEEDPILREFARLCLYLGRSEEAVQIGERAAALQPDNPETLANLACDYVVAARLREAVKTIDAALKLDAANPISLRLQRVINEIVAGTRPQPRNLFELMRPNVQPIDSPDVPVQPTTKSRWRRLRFWKT